MKEKVSIHTEGNDALESARNKLKPYTADGEGTVTEVDLDMVIQSTDSDEESSESESENKQSETERELKEVDPDTQMFDLLEIVKNNPGETVKGIANLSPDYSRGQASPAMTKLWERKLVDRDKEGRAHVYYVTPYGVANLERHD